MSQKTTTLSVAISLALGTALALPMSAHAEEQQVEKLQKMKVTGSRISTTDMEGPNPVDIYTAEDIAELGAVSVEDVLLNLTANGQGSHGATSTNSFAAGTSGVSLRGLGSSRTLVLLNGRRVANYAFGQNMNDTFVDLNSIPLSAVERIDVLKDGASAIYGSDAIAGVINVILKRDFEGFEVKTKTGATSYGDGSDLQATITGGTNIGEDTNLMVSFNAVSKGAIWRKDRPNTDSANLTPDGGWDWTSSRGNPGYVYDMDGNRIDSLCEPGLNDTGYCNYDYAPELTMIPETNRYSLLTTLNHQINDDLFSFVELGLNRVRTHIVSASTPLAEGDGIVVGADNPNNPYGQDVQLRQRLIAGPNRENEITTDSVRIVAGLEGFTQFTEAEMDWSADFGYHVSDTENVGTGYINKTAFQGLIDDGTYNPFATNQRSDIQGAVTSITRTGKSELFFVNASGSMPIYDLPAGEVGLAFGGEYRWESMIDTPDDQILANDIIASGGTASEGSRNVLAAYAEVMVPLHETVEMQLAGRLEHYDDFGNAFSPKVAVRYQPLDELMFRASYSQGFKAPTLPELYMGLSKSFPFISDPQNNFSGQVEQYLQGNPDLDAESSESINVGIVYEPIEDLSIKADIFRITVEDKIATLSAQGLIDEDSPLVIRDPAGNIVRIDNTFMNLNKEEVQGVDAGITYGFETDNQGDFTLGLNGSYTDYFKITGSDGSTSNTAGKDLRGGGPRLKAKASVIWEKDDIKWVNRLNYTSAFDGYYVTADFQEVDSLTTWDTQLAYTGIDQLKFAVGINNVLDTLAPFNNNDQGYSTEYHSNIGRFLYMDVSLSF